MDGGDELNNSHVVNQCCFKIFIIFNTYVYLQVCAPKYNWDKVENNVTKRYANGMCVRKNNQQYEEINPFKNFTQATNTTLVYAMGLFGFSVNYVV